MTLLWAWLQFGEPLTVSALVGVGLTLLGLPLLGMNSVDGLGASKTGRRKSCSR